MSTDAGTIGTPATACLEAASCIDDTDCPEGARCNQVLSPPTCQRLFCGGANTLCSDVGFCMEQHLCLESLCVPCTQCGVECVLTDRDTRHCGGCDAPVRSDQICVNGQPACEEDRTECPDACVDLSSNSSHCGMCQRACAEGSCFGGECGTLSQPWMGGPTTCTAVCAAEGRSCVVADPFPFLPEGEQQPGAGIAAYGTEGNGAQQVLATCGEIAPSMLDGLTFAGMICICATP